MNNRLNLQYEQLETSNLDSFLKNQIELDEMWGKKIWGILLMINLEEQVKAKLSCYQRALEELEPGNLSMPPSAAQHLTFNQVVHCLGNYSLGNDRTWDSIKEAFLQAFSNLDKKYPKIDITFSKLIATKGGIIWCGYDKNDELENLRNDFFSLLPFPKETTKKVHFIHTTVARYKNKLNNPQAVLNYITGHQEEVPMTVNKIILRNETLFPSIEFNDIAQIELK